MRGSGHRQVAAPNGARERKRQETRSRIVETGLRLFLTNGYDATTLDAVAEAAGISRRSFFHHFRSKEEVLVAWQDSAIDQLREAIASRPEDETPIEAARQALMSIGERYASDEMVAIDRLMRSSEVLQARKQTSYLRQEMALLEAMAERWPSPERRAVLRQVAMTAIGVMRLALEAWSREGCVSPITSHLEQGFVDLKQAMAERPA